jgi:hypothetical protein
MHQDLRIIYEKYFSYLTSESGFELITSRYDAESFGNFVLEFLKGEKKIRILSDRFQIIIYIFDPEFGWMDKEELLEEHGIYKTRYGVTDGLWDGFKIAVQSEDLKSNLKTLSL